MLSGSSIATWRVSEIVSGVTNAERQMIYHAPESLHELNASIWCEIQVSSDGKWAGE